MNARERFTATLKFEKTDRPFRWETPGIWGATISRWKNEGLPDSVADGKVGALDFFGMDKLFWLPFGTWTADPFCPYFEHEILEDDGTYVIEQGTDGIIKKNKKTNRETSMPQFLSFPVKTRKDYIDKIIWRYDYNTKERFPENWSESVKKYGVRDYPIGMFVIGPFGHIRNLMGDEEMMYALWDEPDFIHEIMGNWCSFYQGFLKMVCSDVIPDMIMIWEDNCYRNGPLISPDLFIEFMLPYLKKVIDTAKSLNIPGIALDTDGNCTKMLPIYIEAGVNAFYPFECQAGMDIVEVRKQYGKQFAIIGGIDKSLLADGHTEQQMYDEVDKKVRPMMELGGYIPMLDHTVPPNISYSMFIKFIEYVRKITDNRK